METTLYWQPCVTFIFVVFTPEPNSPPRLLLSTSSCICFMHAASKSSMGMNSKMFQDSINFAVFEKQQIVTNNS